jgi:hypothetical protein
MAFTHEFDAFQRWLVKAQECGALPKDTERILIDIPLGEIVRVYCISHGQKAMFNDDLLEVLRGADLIVDGRKGG